MVQPAIFALAIGNPLGFEETVTGRDTPFPTGDLNRSDARWSTADHSGNKSGQQGGPLINLGEVIGMNHGIASTTGGSKGLGFDIPAIRHMALESC